MSSPAITTVIKMMESLPKELQNQVVEHLRDYLDDLKDELKWDKSFEKTQEKLITAAQRAKQEIAFMTCYPNELRPINLINSPFPFTPPPFPNR